MKNSYLDNLTLAEKIREEVICLSLYPDLDKPVIENIIGIIEA